MKNASTYTLSQLHEFIKQMFALNFKESIWLQVEIAQCNLSRGHYYLDLIEKDGDDIIAKASATIWNSVAQGIKNKIGQQNFNAILQDGISVLLKAKPVFSERYGYQLQIIEIDLSFTIGQLALKRQKILENLILNGLIDLNKKILFPSLIQSIAVISSSSAAGWHDFIKQLTNNLYGFKYNVDLFNVRMQGNDAPSDIIKALELIEASDKVYDAVVIIRGGGSKLDLLAFDNEMLAIRVAQCTTPVMVGIGHEIDETVLDFVAHTALKTPTAVAEFIIHKTLVQFSQLQEIFLAIQKSVDLKISYQKQDVNTIKSAIAKQSKRNMQHFIDQLDDFKQNLPKVINKALKNEAASFKNLKKQSQLLNPEFAFNRGFMLAYLSEEQKNGVFNPSDILNLKWKNIEIKTIIKNAKN